MTGPTQKSSKYETGPPQQEKLTKYTGPTQDLLTQTSSKYGTGTPHLAPPFKSQTINAIFPYLTHIVALPSPVVNVIVKCHCIINDVVTNQDMVLPQQFNISSSPHCSFSLNFIQPTIKKFSFFVVNVISQILSHFIISSLPCIWALRPRSGTQAVQYSMTFPSLDIKSIQPHHTSPRSYLPLAGTSTQSNSHGSSLDLNTVQALGFYGLH